jgi:membrane-associated phospholipid phosphatase
MTDATPFLLLALLFIVLWALFFAALPAIRSTIEVMAAWLARLVSRYPRFGTLFSRARERVSPLRTFLPLAFIVLLGVIATIWTLDAFIDLAGMVHARSPVLQRTDAWIHDWAIRRRSKPATIFFEAMTDLGSPVGMGVIAAVVTIGLSIRKRYRWSIYLAATSVGGALLNLELKRHFARARPDIAEQMMRAQGYSFPSGHAMGTTVVCGALAYLGMRSLWGWSAKAATLAGASCIAVSVSISRVYLGVHWLSDVAAGMAAGCAWVFIATVTYEVTRRLRNLRQRA